MVLLLKRAISKILEKVYHEEIFSFEKLLVEQGYDLTIENEQKVYTKEEKLK